MKFYSTNDKNHAVSLKEAVIQGLAPDQGLYMPTEIPNLGYNFFQTIDQPSCRGSGYAVTGAFFKAHISVEQLKSLGDPSLAFDAPLVEVEKDIFALELFHGPTLAFKDFGARFCSILMSLLGGQEQIKV